MKKLLIVLTVITFATLFASCEQEEIAPMEQPELVDPGMTEGNSDKEAGGVKGN